MSNHRFLTVAGLALGLVAGAVTPAASQNTALRADDIAYCHQLKDIYERYLPTRAYGGSYSSTASAETLVALTLCVPGRSTDGVAQLEKVLRGNGYRLPERAIGARQP